MNFTLGIIIAVGALITISLAFIAMDPGYLPGIPVKPIACTKEYVPVCGVDGVSYNNSCKLDSAKIELAYPGECVIEKPLAEGWSRTISTQHPGIGHESHQSVIILPLSEKVYSGTLQYDATESIQLIALHGPLKDGEDKGQAIWTEDGMTKYAMTFVNPDNAQGEWKFAGNALVVHTKKTEPFTVDYMLEYEEKEISDSVFTGTIQFVQDPGMGHESHQLAVIFAPSSDVYSGILSYAASENIQLVSFRGPIGPDEHPEKTWTEDGTTIFEMIFVDPGNKMGSWEFSGNAIALHTKNTTTFTASYSVSAVKSGGMVSPISEMPIAPPSIHMVSIANGASYPGCETDNQCYLPYSLEIRAGDTVSWSNEDIAVHTVTSGSPTDGPSNVFDSSLIMAGASFENTFDEPGSYDYYCMMHPWMIGKIIVNEKFNELNGIAVDEPVIPKVVAPVHESMSAPEPTEKRASPVEVTIAQGAGTPGCEAENQCYLPYQTEIHSGESVVWINVDYAAHTVTSGLPGTPDSFFNSQMIMSNQTWEFMFADSGKYDYYCMVHPWMVGKVVVS